MIYIIYVHLGRLVCGATWLLGLPKYAYYAMLQFLPLYACVCILILLPDFFVYAHIIMLIHTQCACTYVQLCTISQSRACHMIVLVSTTCIYVDGCWGTPRDWGRVWGRVWGGSCCFFSFLPLCSGLLLRHYNPPRSTDYTTSSNVAYSVSKLHSPTILHVNVHHSLIKKHWWEVC